MGKRTKNLTGLSHFAKEAFQQQTSAPDSSSRTAETSASQEREPTTEKSPLRGTHHACSDATGLVPHYKTASQVPERLQKYFAQRHRYFTLYDQGCLLDVQGWYSVTPERIATQIAERCRCDTVLDAFCGVGGNAIAFAKTCEHVIALDISPVRLALAKHNATIYGVADRIEFVLGDYISFAQAYRSRLSEKRLIDVVFLSPPWGGPEYMSLGNNNSAELDGEQTNPHPEFTLGNIKPIHGVELFRLTRNITRNVAYFLPRNASLDEISALLTESPEERVEVEEEWMGTKLKALTCYFGGLAHGQQHLF